MASIGKKILSAFVEVTDDTASVNKPGEIKQSSISTVAAGTPQYADSGKFRQYFENLFREANLPGPDYYEFSKMIDAMNSIPDEKARFSVAFAGLQVQGLDKQKLLATATSYLQMIEKDADNFLSTVDTAIQEKVLGKQKEVEEKNERIRQLTREIAELQQQVAALNIEVKENEERLAQRTGGYKTAMENMKNRILQDTEKIKSFIQ